MYRSLFESYILLALCLRDLKIAFSLFFYHVCLFSVELDTAQLQTS